MHKSNIKSEKYKLNFKESVVKIVKLVPTGRVVSYGQVALYCGIPRAARQVGWILNRIENNTRIPWWRVVNNEGRISIKGSKHSANDQKEKLLKEGVKVLSDLTFDIEKYRFKPDVWQLEEIGLDPFYLSLISDKVPYNKYTR